MSKSMGAARRSRRVLARAVMETIEPRRLLAALSERSAFMR